MSSGDTGAASVSPACLSFSTSNGDRAKAATVRGVNDADGEDETLTVSLSALGGGYAGKTASVSVEVTDDDRNLGVVPATLSIGEAGSGTFTV